MGRSWTGHSFSAHQFNRQAVRNGSSKPRLDLELLDAFNCFVQGGGKVGVEVKESSHRKKRVPTGQTLNNSKEKEEKKKEREKKTEKGEKSRMRSKQRKNILTTTLAERFHSNQE